jgi:hypothetical protein
MIGARTGDRLGGARVVEAGPAAVASSTGNQAQSLAAVVITVFQAPPYTRTITGDLFGPVTVNAGESVLITGARVVGPVTVNPGGA